MERLTRAEEKILLVLWDLERGLVRDVLSRLPGPKPAYTTVSTIIRNLEKKGYVDHKAFGNTHEYFPKVKKGEHRKSTFKSMLKSYFEGSYENLVSYLTREEKLKPADLKKLKALLDKNAD
jgi:predicted transcriptional regulator